MADERDHRRAAPESENARSDHRRRNVPIGTDCHKNGCVSGLQAERHVRRNLGNPRPHSAYMPCYGGLVCGCQCFKPIFVAIGPGSALAIANISPNSSSSIHLYLLTASWRMSGITDGPPPNLLAIANALPGPIATKMAAYLGFKLKGTLGAILATGSPTGRPRIRECPFGPSPP
jgi:hypothetical protein